MPANYNHTTRADGSILTGSIYNADHENHITFGTPGGLDDYSTNVGQMQSSVDPGELGTESLPTDLAGEIQRIRKIITEITGKTYWYESPGTSIVAGTVIDSIFRILGSSDATKKQAFESDTNIPTGTTVTAASQNRNGTLALEESQLFPINAAVASSALTFTLSPCVLAFRSATLGSGSVNVRAVNSAITTVISSGSTGGMVSGEAGRMILLAIDNAGTVELAWCNNRANLLDESTLISTTAEGGAGAADSAYVIYSTTGRSNVPFRILGFIESTQATAGTWATAPSTINGEGGLSSLIANTRIVLGSAVATTSGTTANFTGIPAGVRRLIVQLVGVSLSTGDELLIQFGPVAGLETTGYASNASITTNTPSIGTVSATTGFVVRISASGSAATGRYIFELADASTNRWVGSYQGRRGTTELCLGSGDKALAGALSLVTIKPDGAGSFDAGFINILYER